MDYEIKDFVADVTFWTGIIIMAYIITECPILPTILKDY